MNNILLLSLIALIGFSIIQTTHALTDEQFDARMQQGLEDLENTIMTKMVNDVCNNENPQISIHCNEAHEIMNKHLAEKDLANNQLNHRIR